MYDEFHVLHQLLPEKTNRTHNLRCGLNIRPKYTVSQKTSKIIFVTTTWNLHQIWQFLVQLTTKSCQSN